MSKETQWTWTRGGGQTGRTDILRSPDYAHATSYNSILPISMSRVKDYWHVVEYGRLLDRYQNLVHLAITGALTPQAALDAVAQQHQAVLQNPASQISVGSP